ncbi:hypothetical protein [Aquisphaera insulae]|uniref:hypothetical protein n=1 Tax=Aquisphaera insulae TaxID=2712864 RepID=UPI0013ED5CF6|nr:hypothetical protein [Aquisphaera insulae]
MLKPLTLSLSLAVALGFTSVCMADGCSTCGLASPQGGPIASAQGPVTVGECGDTGHKKCSLLSGLHDKFSGVGCKLGDLHGKLKSALHPPVTYEWVLKKKRLWGHKSGCGDTGCDTCGSPAVYPTSQVAPSGQGGYAAPSGQGGYAAPAAAPQAAPVYGAGQHAFKAVKPAPTIASVPAEMTPAVAGEEAPPAPEVNQSGLLLPTPAGN